MRACGNMRITFANNEQAAIAYPIVIEEELIDYADAVVLEENVIKFEYDGIHISDIYDAPGSGFIGLCETLASKYINFEFEAEANSSDDDFYSFSHKGYFKNQIFFFESITDEQPDLNEMDEEELEEYYEWPEPQTKTKITKGEIINGKLVFE